jgi:Protein of unknown function (DUF2752)
LIGATALHRRRCVANAALACGLLLGAALLRGPPAWGRFYPACPIHQLFGIDCPGCGATRALAALLHGRLREALGWNALFVMLMPIALACAIESYRRAVRRGAFRWPQPPVAGVYATLAVTVAFTIVRNVAR